MKKFILSILFMFFSTFLTVNVSFSADKENVGLYGFYLGQSFPDIIKIATEKSYDNISYQSITQDLAGQVNNIEKIIKDNMVKGINYKVAIESRMSVSGDSNKVSNFITGDYIDKEFDKKMLSTIKNIYKLDYKNKSSEFKISIDTCFIKSEGKPTITILLLRHNSDFNDAKIIQLYVGDIKDIKKEVLTVLTERYGKSEIREKSYHTYSYWNVNNNSIYFMGDQVAFLAPISYYDDFMSYYNNIYNSLEDSNKKAKLQGM